MGLILGSEQLAALVNQAPNSLPSRRTPIKVAMLSLPPRTQSLLEFFFANAGRSSFAPCVEDQAEAAIFDVDTPASRDHWTRFHDRTGTPGIALAVKMHEVPGALWVQKPVTPAALLAAAATLHAAASAAPAPRAAAPVPTPTPAPLDQPLPPLDASLAPLPPVAAAPATLLTPTEPAGLTAVAVDALPGADAAALQGLGAASPTPTHNGADDNATHPSTLSATGGSVTAMLPNEDAKPGRWSSVEDERLAAALTPVSPPSAEPVHTPPVTARGTENAERRDSEELPAWARQSVRASTTPDAATGRTSRPAHSTVTPAASGGLRGMLRRWFGGTADTSPITDLPSRRATPAADRASAKPGETTDQAGSTEIARVLEDAQPAAAREPQTDVPHAARKLTDADGQPGVDAALDTTADHGAPVDRQTPPAHAADVPAADVAQGVPEAAEQAQQPALSATAAAQPAVPVAAATDIAQPEPDATPRATSAAASGPSTDVTGGHPAAERESAKASTPAQAAAEQREEATADDAADDASAVQSADDAAAFTEVSSAPEAPHPVGLFEPEQCLIGPLREAYLVAAKWQVPTQFECPLGAVVVDAQKNEALFGFELERLLAMAAEPIDRRGKVHTLSAGEYTRFKQTASGTELTRVRLDNLLWRVGVSCGRGRLPARLDRSQTVYLSQWPNLTRLMPLPQATRISALWALRGASIDETLATLSIKAREVVDFYNGSWALNLITDDGRLIKRAQRKNARNRGLLTRLIGWLRR